MATVSVANALGFLASFCFTIQYIPQAHLNYKKKSVRGFSASGVIIKLVGAAFLAINSYLTGEPAAVIAYGVCNVSQHLIFMVQFSLYPKEDNVSPSRSYLLWLLFPLLPYALATIEPATMSFTSYIKPIAQVASHIPQLLECMRLKTTSGVSLSTQHLNTIGGLAGLYMCSVLPVSTATLLLYCNSLFQAFSIYYLAWDYGELRKPNSVPSEPTTVHTV